MRQFLKPFLIIPALLFCTQPLWGSHIIGGSMSHKCLGNNTYEFTLILYRDCSCTNCAGFDQIASISVYACGNLINCSNLNQSTSFSSLSIPLLSFETLNNPDIPGLELPAQCLEAGTYKFSITLPPNTESYYAAYQRCCRPETVMNITNPRTTGTSIYTEIKPNAAASCNNSPKFLESISPVFCLGETFEIDHSAVDTDGDSLTYSICSSFKGGGIAGGPEMPAANPRDCNGLTPTPACPPPYSFVNYAAGFSGENPLGTDAQFSINSQTGIITVNPSIAGQYLVTICVNEYRNGLLLNTAYREFTYLATACQTTSTSESLQQRNLKLYPNPAHNLIHITVENQGSTPHQIQIFNTFGQMIERLDNAENQSIDISEWPVGLYNLILLQNGKVIQNEKIVKIQ